jgi:hypothetical protein
MEVLCYCSSDTTSFVVEYNVLITVFTFCTLHVPALYPWPSSCCTYKNSVRDYTNTRVICCDGKGWGVLLLVLVQVRAGTVACLCA